MLVWTDRLARVAAGAGGIVIFAVALTVTASVVMRNVGLRGIGGDFELVEMSCAFAAGLFLPLCQLNKGHVMVDLFTNWLPLWWAYVPSVLGAGGASLIACAQGIAPARFTAAGG